MRSVERALRVLELMTEHSAIGVSELSRSLQIPKTTVQRSLETLARSGWIEVADGDLRRWRLATKPILRIQRAAGRRGSLRAEAMREMEALCASTGETIVFAVRDGNEVVNIDQIESVHLVRISIPPGSHGPLHKTCAGVAIASRLTAAEIDEYVEERCQSDPGEQAEFRAKLDMTRNRGYAVSNLGTQGMIAVSAPVLDSAGRPIAALTLSAPSSRLSMTDLEAIGPRLIEAVSRISA